MPVPNSNPQQPAFSRSVSLSVGRFAIRGPHCVRPQDGTTNERDRRTESLAGLWSSYPWFPIGRAINGCRHLALEGGLSELVKQPVHTVCRCHGVIAYRARTCCFWAISRN